MVGLYTRLEIYRIKPTEAGFLSGLGARVESALFIVGEWVGGAKQVRSELVYMTYPSLELLTCLAALELRRLTQETASSTRRKQCEPRTGTVSLPYVQCVAQ